MRVMISRSLASLLCALPLLVLAAIDVYEFDSPEQEARFRSLTQELRCPKCQNQSIADSDADISGDMRARTAQMIRDGHSDREVVDFFRERYGDFVSYRPPLAANTAVLWLGPGIVLLFGGLLIFRLMRRAARAADQDDDDLPPPETH
ncbi:cytochrome c-type biogenesis protein [Isoalcanivorax indicus]|uniref:cytochrome c-type biogenesis protein n=1 Tax=Isoalcanivorax indicus TaxID=2202653 RepID=UPI001FEB2471|nr:cytochrome c-type biogenesis protein [Isoalcanivorax indicus]